MLTSADFQIEQLYMNNKRRFLNEVMFGSGIVCGCSVFSLDDLSILVESGVAVDDYGREIVIESSVVKKLSAIEGFEELHSNDVFLCLRYKEEDVHSVYSVGHQSSKGNEYEFNRISEGFEFFLIDEDAVEEDFALDDEFLTNQCLYEDSDFEVTLTIPSKVSKGKNVKAVIKVTKKSDRMAKFSYIGTLQTPVFTSEDGEHEITFSFDDVSLFEGQNVATECWMKAQETEIDGAELVMKAGSVKASIDGLDVATSTVPPIKVSILDISPEQLITSEIAKLSLEMRFSVGLRDYLKLAKLTLVRTESAYIIDKITESKVKKFIATPSEYNDRIKYLSFFGASGSEHASFGGKNEGPGLIGRTENTGSRYQIATGTLEIPLGDKVHKGDVRYSGEIMHGLGKGNVYVEIGYECFEDDMSIGTNAKSTIYGKADLFEGAGDKLAGIETAVKVLNDKGSFIAAAKVNREVDFLMLTYRWVAIKFPSGNDFGLSEDISNKSITAETPTVVLGTKDSYFFNVQFHNIEKCSVTYELTEEGSGEISAEGVYTAPSKEGVYEIRIYCTDMPLICTYAYAIVKKKGLEADSTESAAF